MPSPSRILKQYFTIRASRVGQAALKKDLSQFIGFLPPTLSTAKRPINFGIRLIAFTGLGVSPVTLDLGIRP